MKVIALVPIKLNNQRLPGKNLKSFTNGEPLLNYTLRTLLRCQNIDEVFVYCSRESIKEYLPDGVRFLKRSEALDSSSTKANDLIKAFCSEVDADVYVMSHVTAPFIKHSSIDKGIEAVFSGNYDSSFSGKKIQDFLWKNNKPVNYDLNSIPRTQDLEPYYMETSGFYVFTKAVFLENNRRIGNHPFIVEVDDIEAIDIDEEQDFEIADAFFNYRNRDL